MSLLIFRRYLLERSRVTQWFIGLLLMHPNNIYSLGDSSRVDHNSPFHDSRDFSVGDLEHEMSSCLNENSRLKEALRRSREQELQTKKEYDSIFRELQIEQCRLMLTVEEQDNQIRKMARQMTQSATMDAKTLLRGKDLVLLQQEVESLNENLQRIRDSHRAQSSEYQEQVVLLRGLIAKQLRKRENTDLREIEVVLNEKLLRDNKHIDDREQEIRDLERNEAALRKAYDVQVVLLQKEHIEMKTLLLNVQQGMSESRYDQFKMVIDKLRDDNKSLSQQLQLKTNQSEHLIEEIESIKEHQYLLKQQQSLQRHAISEQLQLLVKGFNLQLAEYQNKIMFLLEYLEEVELGKSQRLQEFRTRHERFKEAVQSLVANIV